MNADLDSILNGVDLFGDPIRNRPSTPLAQRFGFPPFTVLDGRGGEWQDRKRSWISIGLKSELGRANGATFGKGLGMYLDDGSENTTSIFDPVLCEMAYTWFTRNDSNILDPFAGGSVRGVIAGFMGRNYYGGELRAEQVAANIDQRDILCPNISPYWVCGDSMVTMDDAPLSDFIFSCPPYGDLEVYSDSPNDLSNMSWDDFLTSYQMIIKKSCARLRENRFACFVVGDFRDKDGNYRDFVSSTIKAFTSCGLHLYNEAILVNSVGTAAMRVTKQFNVSRKMAKTHQNVLVFLKGDARKATKYVTEDAE